MSGDGLQFNLKSTSSGVRGPTGRVYVSDWFEAPSDLRLGAPKHHSKFDLNCSITVAVHSERTHTARLNILDNSGWCMNFNTWLSNYVSHCIIRSWISEFVEYYIAWRGRYVESSIITCISYSSNIDTHWFKWTTYICSSNFCVKMLWFCNLEAI